MNLTMDNIFINNLNELLENDDYSKILNDPFLNRRIQQMNINNDDPIFWKVDYEQTEQIVESVSQFERERLNDDQVWHVVECLMHSYSDLYCRLNTAWRDILNDVELIDEINEHINEYEDIRAAFGFVTDLHSRLVQHLSDNLNDDFYVTKILKYQMHNQFENFLSQFVTDRTYKIKQILNYNQLYLDNSEEKPDQKLQKEAHSVDYVIDQHHTEIGKDLYRIERKLDFELPVDFDYESRRIAKKWTNKIKDEFKIKDKPSDEYIAVLQYRLWKRNCLVFSMIS